MLTGGILTFFLSLISPLVEQFPDLSLGQFLESNAVNVFLDWVRLAGYMLPFETFFAIFSIIVGLHIFRIVIAFFKSLWGILPLA